MSPQPSTRGSGSGPTPYRWGDRFWEDYSPAGTRAYARETEARQSRDIHRLIDAVDANADRELALQSQLLDEFKTYASAADVGWDRIGTKLDDLTDAVASGFSGLEQQLAYHSRLLESVNEKLGAIVYALKHPLTTRANELYHSGRSHLQRKLYLESLRDLTESAELRPVNPLLQLHLAQLHYHARSPEIAVDLDEADKHIGLAMRYVVAMSEELGDEGRTCADLIFRTAAHIQTVRGGDAKCAGDSKLAEGFLRGALSLLGQISKPSLQATFQTAQVEALLGNRDKALKMLSALADYDRAWIARALSDVNLSSVAVSVAALPKELRTKPGRQSKAARDAANRARQYAAAAAPLWQELNADFDPNVTAEEVERLLAEFETGALNASQTQREIALIVNRSGAALSRRIDESLNALNRDCARENDVLSKEKESALRFRAGAASTRDVKSGEGQWMLMLGGIVWVALGLKTQSGSIGFAAGLATVFGLYFLFDVLPEWNRKSKLNDSAAGSDAAAAISRQRIDAFEARKRRLYELRGQCETLSSQFLQSAST